MIRTARPAPKAFALQPRFACRTTSVKAQAFKVTLKTPDGVSEIECDGATFILDAAELAGVALPYSCRAGACSSCVGVVTEGTIDQSSQSFLDIGQEEAGYVLTCIAYPSSDCTIVTHTETELYPSS